jgi:biopolymer transport protein ExbB
MWPLIVCSVVAVAIIFERLWTLQRKRVLPKDLTPQIWELVKHNQLDQRQLQRIAQSSPLGEVFAAGLAQRNSPREVLKEAVEDTGRHVVHELERYLGPLGTIAAISPLLGLLGTVSGMITTFKAMTLFGAGDANVVSGGIAEALITTELGLVVAIPALLAHALMSRRVKTYFAQLENDAVHLSQLPVRTSEA